MECERCGKEQMLVDHDGRLICEDCLDAESEAAYERMCDDFYGGSGKSDQQRQIEAMTLKKG